MANQTHAGSAHLAVVGFGCLQPGWKIASILRLASGEVRISCMRMDTRAAALVRSNISRSYSLTAAGKSSAYRIAGLCRT